jgi:8-oxo-dGTP diphosphatase
MPHIEFIARGVLIDSSRILLCRNIAGGYYYLPGGHVEHGEPAAAALRRELQEEGAIAATIGPCLLVHESSFEARGRKYHEINVVFHVERFEPEAKAIASVEPDISLDWIDLASVVDLDVRPDAIKAWLASGAEPACWLSTMM